LTYLIFDFGKKKWRRPNPDFRKRKERKGK
jgi:hypothetical protein